MLVIVRDSIGGHGKNANFMLEKLATAPLDDTNRQPRAYPYDSAVRLSQGKSR
jgi:hypothetical protein